MITIVYKISHRTKGDYIDATWQIGPDRFHCSQRYWGDEEMKAALPHLARRVHQHISETSAKTGLVYGVTTQLPLRLMETLL